VCSLFANEVKHHVSTSVLPVNGNTIPIARLAMCTESFVAAFGQAFGTFNEDFFRFKTGMFALLFLVHVLCLIEFCARKCCTSESFHGSAAPALLMTAQPTLYSITLHTRYQWFALLLVLRV
jgi:hypothetical protein